MRVIYPPFVNQEGTYDHVDTDLNGNVSLVMLMKGKVGQIVLTPSEALQLINDLRKKDVEALAKIYAA
jgi:hypothetical protein